MSTSAGCFSGSSMVVVKGKDQRVKMKDLNIGDLVHVGNDIYEPIYSFRHRLYKKSTHASNNMIQIRTMKSTLTLTPDHLVFIMKSEGNGDGSIAIPSSQIKVGDRVVTGEKSIITTPIATNFVLSIKNATEHGLFNPFTPSGKIVVDVFYAPAILHLNIQTNFKFYLD